MSDTKIVGKIVPAVEKAREILELEPEKRLKAILDSPRPLELSRALPPQEFWITIKRIGASDTLELIELASDEQLIFIQDIECWAGDKIDPERALKWLEQLHACGPEKVAQWLKAVDADTFITAMRNFMEVTKPDEGTDPHRLSDTMPPYTIDQVYFLHFHGEREREVLTPIISIFAGMRFDIYARMMEAMVWESGIETEEQALRWRNGRLSDFGIPSLDDAMAIYNFLDKPTFFTLPEKSAPMPMTEGYAPPRFAMVAPGRRMLLMDALNLVPAGEMLDGIAVEIAHLANRVIIADQLNVDDADNMTEAVEKVRAILSMGLEILAGANLQSAADSLQSRWLLHIFQIGYSQILKLARRAHKLHHSGWLKEAGKAKALLGHPLIDILDGLHRPRPLWYAGGAEPYRSFESIEEVRAADEAINRIEYLGPLFLERIKIITPDPLEWTFKSTYPVDINFETILRTALANAAAGRGFVFKPLRKEDLRQFIENAFQTELREIRGHVSSTCPQISQISDLPRKKRLKPEVERDLIAFLASQGTARNDIERRLRDDLVRSAIQFLEDELGRLDPDSLEPRYIQGLVIRKP